jgi:hypothetical protein
LAWATAVAISAGAGALLTMPPAVRWSVAVPLVPALVVAGAVSRGHEKSWPGETAAAVAFSGAAVPIALAARASIETGAAVAIPFALLFVGSTLAVRAAILRVRGGGDARAANATRRAALALVAGAAVGLGVVVAVGLLSVIVLVAAAPGLLTVAGVATRPPAPGSLRPLGWTLIAVSVTTAAVVIAATS